MYTEILEEVINKIDDLVTEEYGISNEIVSVTNEISNLLLKAISNNKENGTKVDSNNIKYVDTTIKQVFHDKPLLVRCVMYYFKDDKTFDKLKKLYNFNGKSGETKIKNGIVVNYILVNSACINGRIVNDTFSNTIQHELTHLYDNIVYNNDLLNDKKQKLYDTAVNVSRNSKNVLERRLARCIYICFKHEQIAHANGLDNIIANNDLITINDVRETIEYKYLVLLSYVIKNFETYKSIGKNIFTIDDEKLLEILNNGYKNYCRRIGRVIYKYQNKIYGELGND